MLRRLAFLLLSAGAGACSLSSAPEAQEQPLTTSCPDDAGPTAGAAPALTTFTCRPASPPDGFAAFAARMVIAIDDTGEIATRIHDGAVTKGTLSDGSATLVAVASAKADRTGPDALTASRIAVDASMLARKDGRANVLAATPGGDPIAIDYVCDHPDHPCDGLVGLAAQMCFATLFGA